MAEIIMKFYFSSQETWAVTLEVNTNFLSLTFSFLRVDDYLFLHSQIYKRYDTVLGLTWQVLEVVSSGKLHLRQYFNFSEPLNK